ncbi:MAG: hypothetical protein CMO55_08640 [Verrucomicrobiales bacterium]|nr:hypothetical protein [Verrucomicrobiales bacterium]
MSNFEQRDQKEKIAVAEEKEFPITAKSFYDRIHSKDPEEIRRTLEAFCERYWLPMYVFLRRSRENHHDASDIVQDFVAGELLTRNTLSDWNPSLGPLHSFIKTCIDRFRKKFHRSRLALKRGGDRAKTHVSLNTEGACDYFETKLIDRDESPDMAFDREWAYVMMNDTLRRIRTEYSDRGRLREFELLFKNLEIRANVEMGELSYQQIGEELDLDVNVVKKRMKRLRIGFHQKLRDTVADTVDPEEVEKETAYIFSLLS